MADLDLCERLGITPERLLEDVDMRAFQRISTYPLEGYVVSHKQAPAGALGAVRTDEVICCNLSANVETLREPHCNYDVFPILHGYEMPCPDAPSHVERSSLAHA